jgi:hypothetical protein
VNHKIKLHQLNNLRKKSCLVPQEKRNDPFSKKQQRLTILVLTPSQKSFKRWEGDSSYQADS